MNSITTLKPQALWYYFDALCQLPRPSGHEEVVRAYIRTFAEAHQLEFHEDTSGNILVKKEATPGMEHKKTIILQSHLDMVPQKNKDSPHNFLQDPISTYVDGDWVKAKGTTLGADNGIGVAAMLALLAETNLKHGSIEALFTVEEETGMTGAYGLSKEMLTGTTLLNLDTEEEGELCIGCAGGINITGSIPVEKEKTPPEQQAFLLTIKGLRGGHSGLDINLGRGNANLILAQTIRESGEGLSFLLHQISGGSLRNAIPREAQAIFSVPKTQTEKLQTRLEALEIKFNQVFGQTDPKLEVICSATETPVEAYTRKLQKAILHTLLAIPNGVITMHDTFPGVVETSNNTAAIKEYPNRIEILSLLRSSSEEAKKTLCQRIKQLFEISGFQAHADGDYPGWQPDPHSTILSHCKQRYQALFKETPTTLVVHAGLETGLLKKNYPQLDIISFGPDICFPHSPDEKVNIHSVMKFWLFLCDVINTLP